MASLSEQVAELNNAFLKHVARHSDMLAEYFDPAGYALADLREHRINQALPGRLQVPPPLLPGAVRHHLASRHRALRAALSEIFERRLGGQWERLASELRLSEASRRYLDKGHQPHWAAIARPDCVLHGDVITMVEPNGGSSAGGMPDTDTLGRRFEAAPVIGDFLRDIGAVRQDAMRAVADLLQSRLTAGGRNPDGLVLVTDLQMFLHDGEPGHVELFAAELRRNGLQAQPGAIEDVDCAAGPVTWHGQAVDLIYRVWADQPDAQSQYPVLEPVLRAARSGRVLIFDDLDDQIVTTKAALVLLSEELDAGNVAPRLAGELSSFIPWSRFVADGPVIVNGTKTDLLPWAASNQDRLVLKPCHGYQGRGVTIGCELASQQWAQALADAVGSDEAWLVQALAASDAEAVGIVNDGKLISEKTFADYGYFMVGNEVAGILRRSAPVDRPSRLVIHSAHGPVFFV